MVGSMFLSLFPVRNMNDIVSYKYFFSHPDNIKFPIPSKGYNVNKRTAITDKFIFLQAVANKSFLAINIQFCVIGYDAGCMYGIECGDLCFSLLSFAILFK